MSRKPNPIKIELEALDGKDITKDSETSKVTAIMPHFPIEGKQANFLFVDEPCSIPFATFFTHGVKYLRNEIRFVNEEKRTFIVRILR